MKREGIKQILWYWLPLLLWMGLIFFLSAQSTLLDLADGEMWWHDVLDRVFKKSGHAFVYGVLAWLYLRVLRQHPIDERMAVLRAASIGLAVLYGMSDEYHQTFVPGREGKLFDVAVDGIGASIAMLLDWWRMRRRPVPPASPSPAR